ncbi:hydratase [Rhizomicrobium sp. SCGC AG-212-E05]|nr:hydratase [Rhizomicrobium sp. SCGC AG-212-E05]
MTPEQKRETCELLYRHWQQGTRLDGLPPQLVPADRAEAYQVQALIEGHTSHPLYGWKIAATSIAGQKHIGVDGPLAGRILAERVIADGGSCILGSNLMKVAEMEFAFRMAQDLPPRATDYSQDEVMASVASLHPAIEIPDSRYNKFENVGLASLIADNACAHRFALGAQAKDWRELDLAAHRVRGLRNGAVAEEGLGSNVLGGPAIALTWLANELSRHGMTLKAGQVVTTGTCVKPLAIAAGDRVEGDFGALGRVAVTII